MTPLIPLGAVALGALLLFSRSRPPTQRTGTGVPVSERSLPSRQLAAVVNAARSGDPREMRRVAEMLRSEGFGPQATELERLARETERAGETPQNPIDVEEPPPGAQPEPSPALPPERVPAPTQPERPVERDEPPAGATPLPVPTEEERRIPPGTDQLVADYARMVYASAPRGPVIDPALSDAFKRATGTRGDKKFYGQGPALALIERGVVPPTPWDWQRANPEQDKASYRRQLTQARSEDPSRSDLWDLAIADVR